MELIITREKIGSVRKELEKLNLNYELNSNHYIMEEICINSHYNRKVSLARIREKIVGWSVMTPTVIEASSPPFLADIAVYVAPEHRGKGIGKALVAQEIEKNKRYYNGICFYNKHIEGFKLYTKIFKKYNSKMYIKKMKTDFNWSVFFYSKQRKINAYKKINENQNWRKNI